MKATLEGMGYLVVVPKFPTPAGQSYESWKAVLKNYLSTFDAETIVVGHGAGGAFALRLVESLPKPIAGLFLVAGYGGPIGNVGYDRVNKTFYEPALKWDKILANARIRGVFAGADDPFVPTDISQALADNLKEAVETIPNGGHLNKASGFTQLVPVAQGIKERLSSLDKSIQIEPEFVPRLPEYLFPKVPSTTPEQVQTEKPPLSEGVAKPGVSDQRKTNVVNGEASPFAEHTMYEDMSHLVNSNQGKVASSLLTQARNEESVKKAKSPASPKNILYVIASAVVILAVIGIGGYLLSSSVPVSRNPQQQQIQSLVQTEIHTKIEVTPNQPFFMLEQAIEDVVAQPTANGDIRDIYYASAGQRVSFSTVLTALGITDIPSSLSQEFAAVSGLTPVFMHGIYQNDQGTSHFLVLKVNDYGTSFALMQQWEGTMLADLGPFFGVSKDFLKTRLVRDTFDNEIISNENVRVLRYHAPASITLDGSDASTAGTGSPNAFVGITSPYQDNDIMLAYFFLDEHTIVIVDKVEIIPELLKRFANSQIY